MLKKDCIYTYLEIKRTVSDKGVRKDVDILNIRSKHIVNFFL
jgi:hypothetical protein